jgi:hypothetical protein
MAYISVAELKTYLDISSATDDALLAALVNSAEAAIDAHTHRTFEADTETRYFERHDLDDSGFILELDRDLLTVTTLTNGDSASTVIPATEYWLVDAMGRRGSGPPYHGIRLKINSTYSWEFDTDYWVSVLGTWGYCADPPNDIKHATKRLAAYYYAQKDAQVFDVTAVAEAGIIQVPQGIPRDVKLILEPYVRQGLA